MVNKLHKLKDLIGQSLQKIDGESIKKLIVFIICCILCIVIFSFLYTSTGLGKCIEDSNINMPELQKISQEIITNKSLDAIQISEDLTHYTITRNLNGNFILDLYGRQTNKITLIFDENYLLVTQSIHNYLILFIIAYFSISIYICKFLYNLILKTISKIKSVYIILKEA